jgi:hypothetical protein
MKITGRDDYLKSRLNLLRTAGQTIQDSSECGESNAECQSAESETHSNIGTITDGVLQRDFEIQTIAISHEDVIRG